MVFTVAIYTHALLAVILFFSVRIDKVIFMTFITPFLEFPVIALLCRLLLEYYLRFEVRRMKPEELKSYHAQLKK